MSGSDFRSFLTVHQSKSGNKDRHFLVRALEGKKVLYTPVDYDKLNAITKIKHSVGEKALLRVNEINKNNSQNKERFVLKEHQRICELELHNLSSKFKVLLNELEAIRSCHGSILLDKEIDDYRALLAQDFEHFKEITLVPLYNLRADIKHWLNKTKRVCQKENTLAVCNEITSVKVQHSFVIEQLKKEQLSLEEELSKHNKMFICLPYDLVKMSYPEELAKMSCPDESLKKSFLSTFQRLSEKYIQNINDLKVRFDKIDSDPLGGWSKNDNFVFTTVVKQYSKITLNRRKLYMDRLGREMPHFNSAQLLSYEKWWLNDRLFKSQLREIFHSWERDRIDLTFQVKHLIEEAQFKYEESEEIISRNKEQKFICKNLHEKLRKYQEEMEEIFLLEAKQRTLVEENEKKRLTKMKNLEKKKKEQLKMQLVMYKEEIEKKSGQIKAQYALRLLELRDQRAKQRLIDEERIRYREEIFRQKLMEKKHIEKLKEKKIEATERALQALRDQVSVTAKSDPLRIIEHTEASKARLAAAYDLEKEAQEPLFPIHTYSVEQIGSDMRLKVEMAFRSANIHNTDYARNLIPLISPPTRPRKDNQSTIFKQDFI